MFPLHKKGYKMKKKNTQNIRKMHTIFLKKNFLQKKLNERIESATKMHQKNTKYTVHPCQNRMKDEFFIQNSFKKIRLQKIQKRAHKEKKGIVDPR